MNNKNDNAPKKIFFHQEDVENNGFSDIFRRWEDGSVKGGSVVSYDSKCSAGRSRKGEGPFDNMSDVSSVSKRHDRGRESVASKSSSQSHRRAHTESTLPRMDDWMNNKLDKYEQFKNEIKRIELTPPPPREKVEVRGSIASLPLHHKKIDGMKLRSDEQHRDDIESETEARLDAKLKSKLKNDENSTVQYYRALGQNESLQNQLDAKNHEIACLHHRLQDMEGWYQSRLEELGAEHRKAEKMYYDSLEEVRKENEGMKLEIDRLTKANDDVNAACESMERDLAHQKNETERLLDERQREKDSHEEMMSTLAEEKERAFHDANDWKMRQKEIHDAMMDKMKEDQEAERKHAYHEVNDWKMRFESASRELEEMHRMENRRVFEQTHELQTQMQSMKRELEAEMTRNAAMNKDKNAMADMLDNNVTKMEQMQRQIMELEKQKVDLMVTNNELEAENTRVKVMAREKTSLEGTVDGYHMQMADLQRKNQELEREVMSLKQELIDVLDVASTYQ